MMKTRSHADSKLGMYFFKARNTDYNLPRPTQLWAPEGDHSVLTGIIASS